MFYNPSQIPAKLFLYEINYFSLGITTVWFCFTGGVPVLFLS
ncbi:hypothetical protein UF75_3601 [Desulfosporosinus sp. I2]|nr:hypothetical protein UF75_3601 [Desulfosporosinus sp. I2]